MTQQTLFHVTPLRNLGRIRAEGLLAQLGPRASAACERAPAVFCFPSREDLDNALSNWMGEDFEDSPGELAIVELRSPLSAKRDACAASYEVVLLDPVPSHAIVAAYRDDWSPIDHFHVAPHEVPAEVHTDEHTVTVHFDASHALRSMTDKQILDLAREEFRTSEAADTVAYSEADRGNADVTGLLDFCLLSHRTGQPQGFEVCVDGESALAWLLHHRPAQYAACIDIQDGIDHSDDKEG